MNKKGLAALAVSAVMSVSCFGLAACGTTGGKKNTNVPSEYTIQYTDDSGAHTLTVTQGMPYSLDVVPTKNGYVFTGLFDAETGGTQYVSANGSSLAPFNDKKNLVLFPQYKAKDFNVILDYQGAAVTGGRQFTVSYGSSLPGLPKNLTLEHKEFAGWFTEVDCGGVQVADEYGLVPLVSVLNENNFDLSGANITLYAGFEIEKFTVTCCFEAGMDTEDVKVEYDTPVNKIVPKTRVDGNAPLTWSKTQGGEVFNGKVTDDLVLYAVEYAPVIELDTNGGSNVAPVVARAGSTVALPTPTKDMAKFAYWEDMQGEKYTSTTMPNKSISLKAVWQAKLVFDENGGSDVDDISVKAGEKITLPTPEKEGFIFAGWYTAEKKQYTSTTMPAAGVKLKAGWYKEKTNTVVMINSSSSVGGDKPTDSPSMSYLCYAVDYSKYFGDDNNYYNIIVDATANLKGSKDWEYTGYVDFYSQKQVSSVNLIKTFRFENLTNSFKKVNFKLNANINDDLYMCFYSSEGPHSGWSYNYLYISDFYFTVYYPDTTNLYL